MPYWEIKDFGKVIDGYVERAKARFPPPSHDARFLIIVSKERFATTSTSPFRLIYEDESEEEISNSET